MVSLSLGSVACSAQSSPAFTHSAQAVRLSGVASGEGSAAVGASSAELVSTVVAVPLWMIGGVASGSGEILTAAGQASGNTGRASLKGADALIQTTPTKSEPFTVAVRAALDRERAVPAAKRKDPSPAEAMKALQ